MIPKTIHYCWFGHGEKPELAKKCIISWEKYCPDYEIIEWNEENFDIATAPLYVRQAYEVKKWAFVTDYVRLKVVYDNGGIYLDTDVQLLKPLDDLLAHSAFFGFENVEYINTGIGFGSEKAFPIIKEMLDEYANISFIKKDGSLNTEACPVKNTRVLVKNGLILNNSCQLIASNIIVLPTECLCPLDWRSKKLHRTDNTFSIHWYNASWWEEKDKIWHVVRVLANRTALLFGNKTYQRFLLLCKEIKQKREKISSK